MGFIQNFSLNRKRKADAKKIEQIKKLSNPKEIFSAIEHLELEESVMRVFHLFDENHVYDSFKSGRYEDITTFFENPATIFEECVKEQDNRYTIFQWLYENGMTHDAFQYCFRRSSEEYFFIHITNQTYREEMLKQMYDKSKLPDEVVFDVLSGMEAEKREQFMAEHTLSEAIRLKIDKQIFGKIWVDKTDDEIKGLLTVDEVNHDLYEISHAQAREFLERFGNEMSSANLRHCILVGYLDGEEMEVLPFYKDRMNSEDLNSIFERIAFDYRNMRGLIEQYTGEMQEETLMKVFRTYNEVVDYDRITQNREDEEKEGRIPFAKHAEEEPHFLYDMAKLYYDKKLEDEQFETQYVNFVMAEFLLADQLKFASEYKEKMPMITIDRIEETLTNSENLDAKGILTNYQGILSRNAIVALINAQSFDDRMELIKSCNLSGEEKSKVIEFAKRENRGSNTSFLEMAMSVAELESRDRMGEKTGFEKNKTLKDTNLGDSENVDISKD